jgi:pimeloyl-ACP methyl ester carboxylesterase
LTTSGHCSLTWAEEFDWPAHERGLNQFAHFRARLDETYIHFVHQRARHGRGIPLILTHGWPSSFVEYLPLVPLLTDPQAFRIDSPAFDVVIPSLPGYGFSERPARIGVNYCHVAGLWHRLMQGLGYQRYGAGGGDFGAGVATFMALDNPERLVGIHLSNLEIPPYTGPDSRPLSQAERAYLAQNEQWWASEQGYKVIQSTKPQTLGYGLNDSPAGLAAWILEKWRSWGDTRGDLDGAFSRDFLLTNIMIYWATQTITPSIRDYFDNRMFSVQPGLNDFVTVPTAGPGLLDVFAAGPSNHLWHWRKVGAEPWSVAEDLGGDLPAEGVSAVSWGPNRIDVFAASRAPGNPGNPVQHWASVGGGFVRDHLPALGLAAGTVSAVSSAANVVDRVDDGQQVQRLGDPATGTTAPQRGSDLQLTASSHVDEAGGSEAQIVLGADLGLVILGHNLCLLGHVVNGQYSGRDQDQWWPRQSKHRCDRVRDSAQSEPANGTPRGLRRHRYREQVMMHHTAQHRPEGDRHANVRSAVQHDGPARVRTAGTDELGERGRREGQRRHEHE